MRLGCKRRALTGVALLWLSAQACDDDARPVRSAPSEDAGLPVPAVQVRVGGGAFHAAVPDAGRPALADAALPAQADPQLARGEYLVRNVGGCMDCHTPRLPSGEYDQSRLLSGVHELIDVEPDDPSRGAIHSRNLTPHESTGLGRLSNAQIKRAFQDGFDADGRVLHWMMPYWIFRNMSAEDADSVVAYLRTIPAIDHDVPDNQPSSVELRQLHEPYTLALDALPKSTLPAGHPDRASAEQGRYLATALSPCLLCHSPPHPAGPALPIDVELAFTGRRRLWPVPLSLPFEQSPRVRMIESRNLTPSENGLGLWTPLDVARALLSGMGRELPVCDPMPSANLGDSFRGMTREDAFALGHYFTSLPPKDTGPVENCCTGCHQAPKPGTNDPDPDAGAL